LPPGTVKEGTIPVEGVGKHLKSYQTAQVPITVQGNTKMVEMAIAPTADIPYPVILGNNIPGTSHTWKWMKELEEPAAVFSHPDTKQPPAALADHDQASERAREGASQVVWENAKEAEPGGQHQQEAQESQNQQLQRTPATAEDNRGKPSEKEDPTQPPMTVAPTVTRAASRQHQDNKPDSQQDQNPSDQHQTGDCTLRQAPFSVEELKQQQKEDRNLKDAWEEAQSPVPGRYKVRDGILYWILTPCTTPTKLSCLMD